MYRILQIYFLASNNRELASKTGFSSFLFCIIYVFCVHCCLYWEQCETRMSTEIEKQQAFSHSSLSYKQYFHGFFAYRDTFTPHHGTQCTAYNIRHGSGARNDTETNTCTHTMLHCFAVGWKRFSWNFSYDEENYIERSVALDFQEIPHVFHHKFHQIKSTFRKFPKKKQRNFTNFKRFQVRARTNCYFFENVQNGAIFSSIAERYSFEGVMHSKFVHKNKPSKMKMSKLSRMFTWKTEWSVLATVYPMQWKIWASVRRWFGFGYSTFSYNSKLCISVACSKIVHVQRNPEAPLCHVVGIDCFVCLYCAVVGVNTLFPGISWCLCHRLWNMLKTVCQFCKRMRTIATRSLVSECKRDAFFLFQCVSIVRYHCTADIVKFCRSSVQLHLRLSHQ